MIYSTLKTAIIRWLNKENLPDADTVAAELIELCEARMRRDIIAQPSTQTLDLTITDVSYPLPCGFDGLISLTRTSEDRSTLTYRPPDILDTLPRGAYGLNYTITGNMIYFDAAPGDVRMRYRSLFSPLSSTNRTNWILDKHPDVYLFGSLVDSAAYFRDDERTPVWEQKYADAVSSINRQSIRQQTNANLTTRVSQCP
jgi:hypothetical protein